MELNAHNKAKILNRDIVKAHDHVPEAGSSPMQCPIDYGGGIGCPSQTEDPDIVDAVAPFSVRRTEAGH